MKYGLYNTFYGIFSRLITSPISTDISELTADVLAKVCSIIIIAMPFILLYKFVNMVLGG